MRTKINKINFETAEKVLENNKGLDQRVFDYMMEDQNSWLDEILKGCHEDYCIDPCGYSYFKVMHTARFIGWLEDVVKDYCLFKDSDMETINKYMSKYDEWFEEDDSDKAYDLEDDIEELEKVVEEIVCNELKGFYEVCYDKTERAVYFLDMMDIFIDDMDNTFITDDYKVKQFIPKRIIPQRVIPAETVTLF